MDTVLEKTFKVKHCSENNYEINILKFILYLRNVQNSVSILACYYSRVTCARVEKCQNN